MPYLLAGFGNRNCPISSRFTHHTDSCRSDRQLDLPTYARSPAERGARRRIVRCWKGAYMIDGWKTIRFAAGAVVLVAAIIGPALPAAAAATVDHGIFAELLMKYLKNGVVDYAGFK